VIITSTTKSSAKLEFLISQLKFRKRHKHQHGQQINQTRCESATKFRFRLLTKSMCQRSPGTLPPTQRINQPNHEATYSTASTSKLRILKDFTPNRLASGLTVPSSNPGRNKTPFILKTCPDQLWDPPSLYSKRTGIISQR
jgi:hypothetical protein